MTLTTNMDSVVIIASASRTLTGYLELDCTTFEFSTTGRQHTLEFAKTDLTLLAYSSLRPRQPLSTMYPVPFQHPSGRFTMLRILVDQVPQTTRNHTLPAFIQAKSSADAIIDSLVVVTLKDTRIHKERVADEFPSWTLTTNMELVIMLGFGLSFYVEGLERRNSDLDGLRQEARPLIAELLGLEGDLAGIIRFLDVLRCALLRDRYVGTRGRSVRPGSVHADAAAAMDQTDQTVITARTSKSGPMTQLAHLARRDQQELDALAREHVRVEEDSSLE
uniref:Uncharacterized protein n=1 Tax=Mycena chlorophos TaxID=658473 RepID=A0ABQ0LIF5_MYCCL|nr:predicted protein [Mycena chlorophos]